MFRVSSILKENLLYLNHVRMCKVYVITDTVLFQRKKTMNTILVFGGN